MVRASVKALSELSARARWLEFEGFVEGRTLLGRRENRGGVGVEGRGGEKNGNIDDEMKF